MFSVCIPPEEYRFLKRRIVHICISIVIRQECMKIHQYRLGDKILYIIRREIADEKISVNPQPWRES
jgi:hypothetical protein